MCTLINVELTTSLRVQTQLEGRRPFTVIAVFSAKLGPAARFLQAHLLTVVKRTLQASSAGSRVSPLYSAFIKLHSAYKKQTPLHDSIFTHAECSVVLLDLLRGRLFSLSYGSGTHPPHVTSSLGHAAFPAASREHTLEGIIVEDAVYDHLGGDHHVVLGSPGLWCVTPCVTTCCLPNRTPTYPLRKVTVRVTCFRRASSSRRTADRCIPHTCTAKRPSRTSSRTCRQHVHPSKVALHAAAYAAAPQLTTSELHHDAASAIVRCALRKVADRCAASPSARLSCLNTLAQLDRLRPGSRAEARSSPAIAPRMRGDIHADMTAATLSFTLHSQPATPRGSAADAQARHIQECPMCRYAATHLVNNDSARRSDATPAALDLTSAPSQDTSADSATGSTRELHASTSAPHTDSPRSRHSCSGRSSNLVARTLFRISHRRCPFSRPGGKASASSSRLHSSDRATLYAASAPSSGVSPLAQVHSDALRSGGGDPQQVARRWELLRRHVRLMALETGLRQSMWHAAVAVVRSTQHSTHDSAEGGDSCSTCSSCGSDAAEAADAVAWRAADAEADEGTRWQMDGQRIGDQVCGRIAAC